MLGDHLVFPILLSKDLEASRAFYHDTLGLEILREDDERDHVPVRGRVDGDGDVEHRGNRRRADPAGLARPRSSGRA
jgi:catechol 2,3-dioxygenase-like lactoylglutathione lyase family enzyme